MKATKLFYNNTRLKDVYVGASWFEVMKFKIARAMRATVLFMVRATLICVGIVMLFLIARHFFPEIKYVNNTVEIDNLSVKIESLRAGILDDIKRNENGGVVTYDPPKGQYLCPEDFASFGAYQFKVCTVKGYYKSLYGKTITKKEAVLIALDEQKARQLAYDIIFKANKGDKGIGNWLNTSNKEKIAKRVELLATLTK